MSFYVFTQIVPILMQLSDFYSCILSHAYPFFIVRFCTMAVWASLTWGADAFCLRWLHFASNPRDQIGWRLAYVGGPHLVIWMSGVLSPVSRSHLPIGQGKTVRLAPQTVRLLQLCRKCSIGWSWHCIFPVTSYRLKHVSRPVQIQEEGNKLHCLTGVTLKLHCQGMSLGRKKECG